MPVLVVAAGRQVSEDKCHDFDFKRRLFQMSQGSGGGQVSRFQKTAVVTNWCQKFSEVARGSHRLWFQMMAVCCDFVQVFTNLLYQNPFCWRFRVNVCQLKFFKIFILRNMRHNTEPNYGGDFQNRKLPLTTRRLGVFFYFSWGRGGAQFPYMGDDGRPPCRCPLVSHPREQFHRGHHLKSCLSNLKIWMLGIHEYTVTYLQHFTQLQTNGITEQRFHMCYLYNKSAVNLKSVKLVFESSSSTCGFWGTLGTHLPFLALYIIFLILLGETTMLKNCVFELE